MPFQAAASGKFRRRLEGVTLRGVRNARVGHTLYQVLVPEMRDVHLGPGSLHVERRRIPSSRREPQSQETPDCHALELCRRICKQSSASCLAYANTRRVRKPKQQRLGFRVSVGHDLGKAR